jgi:hypothetical protein
VQLGRTVLTSGNHAAVEQFIGDWRCHFVDECSAHLRIAVKELHRFNFSGTGRRFLLLFLL